MKKKKIFARQTFTGVAMNVAHVFKKMNTVILKHTKTQQAAPLY